MGALKDKIKELIRKEGPITFERFMQGALYEPGLGYYARGPAPIGREGDFYTSSHLHPAFGAMLGVQMQEMRLLMGRPAGFTVVEMGAGAGYTAADMLGYLRDKEIFAGLRYVIVEPNPENIKVQREILTEYGDKASWVSSLKEVGPVCGCVLTNELLDALPVHLIEMDNGLKEIFVGIGEDGNFIEIKDTPSTPAIAAFLEEFNVSLPDGYRTEVCLRAAGWFNEAASALTEGFILTVDYGYSSDDYYSEDRSAGTLLCYKKHRISEDPLTDIGAKDITAHVNFSALKRWANEAGLKNIGFTPQGQYLVSLGIDGLIEEIYAEKEDYAFHAAKIKGLIMPGTMGETHKVLVQYKGPGEPVLKGFELRNRIDTL